MASQGFGPVRALPRPFEMHWGGGQVVEEASADTPYHEPTVQLLEFDDGSLTLRFCYYNGPRFGRGPMMIGEAFLDGLAASVQDSPRIQALLRRIAGC